MTRLSRRAFLQSAAALAVAGPASAIDPVRRDGPPSYTLSLAAYSFRDELKPKKGEPTMTLGDFIDFAARHSFAGVELTSYYFPDDKPATLDALRERAAGHKLAVTGSAVGNDFTTADPAKRKKEIDHVRAWLTHTARLGGKTLRVFAGNRPKGEPDDEKARGRCVEALQEVCDHAGTVGVYAALENHGGITASADGLLALAKAVNHRWFGVNLDTGNFRTADPYADLAKLAPYAVNVQVKTEVQRAGQKKEEADLKRIVQMLKDVKYSGAVVLEYEAAEPAREAVPRYGRELRGLLGG